MTDGRGSQGRRANRATAARRTASRKQRAAAHEYPCTYCLGSTGAPRPGRATVDSDGSVLGTRRWAEGAAVGYNPGRKG